MPLPVFFRASGTVRGRTTITLTSKVSGYVRAIHVRSGDTVTPGQVLVELEANDTRAGVGRQRAELAQAMDAQAEAQSALEAAKATAQLAKISRDRTAKLFAEGAVTRQAMDEADAQALTTAAQLAAAQARVRGAGSSIDVARASLAEGQATLDYARVTAPFGGRVVERRVDPGALASPGLPLLVLDDGGSLRVEVPVEESRAAAIHLGDPVSVEIGTQQVSGTVGEIVPNVDVASRAFLVKVDLPASVGAIPPGTFARVGFANGTRSKLVVPTTAITSFGALDRVVTIDSGVARLRMITRGDVQDGWTEVLSGLAAGEPVVVDPTRVRDGARVEVKP
ncbi:MAG TPA: efflux RND transporter periplasmic adaptor subunit [Kofleriaceae bacterium]|nr:efflux RND transporter periplasmic adaptor subunit [Kofleriaceae bacterium]